MNLIEKIISSVNKDSYSASSRRKRFDLFRQMIELLPMPVEVLDVGGTQRFWEVMGFVGDTGVNVTILNLSKPKTSYPNFKGVAGDATNLSEFTDNQFDMVFSNSVIEHVGSFEQQQKMAIEVQRVGRSYFLQTPNYYFPIEPHFVFPGFQWLPLSVRAFMINHWNLGWCKRISEPNSAREFVEQIRLMRKKELKQLFPDGDVYEEKVVGLTKSFVVYSVFGSS